MSTRSKKKNVQPSQKEPHLSKHITNSWILMVKDALCENPNFSFLTLPHPCHGKPNKYCLDSLNKKMFEVITFEEPYRSWFIGDTVKSNGNLLMVTPFNPLFLVLSRLRNQCSNRAIPLEDLLSEKGFSKIQEFINLDLIADVKEAGDIRAYKYNEGKTISWLEKRVRVLADLLKAKNIHVSSGAASATFVSSSVNNVDDEIYLKYAFGIISEYLDDYFNSVLEKHFNFPADIIESIGNKRKTEEMDVNNGVSKKLKYESNNEQENMNILNTPSTEVKTQKPLTAKEKARQKAASGTKTISAFFTKK